MVLLSSSCRLIELSYSQFCSIADSFTHSLRFVSLNKLAKKARNRNELQTTEQKRKWAEAQGHEVKENKRGELGVWFFKETVMNIGDKNAAQKETEEKYDNRKDAKEAWKKVKEDEDKYGAASVNNAKN